MKNAWVQKMNMKTFDTILKYICKFMQLFINSSRQNDGGILFYAAVYKT